MEYGMFETFFHAVTTLHARLGAHRSALNRDTKQR